MFVAHIGAFTYMYAYMFITLICAHTPVRIFHVCPQYTIIHVVHITWRPRYMPICLCSYSYVHVTCVCMQTAWPLSVSSEAVVSCLSLPAEIPRDPLVLPPHLHSVKSQRLHSNGNVCCYTSRFD